MSNPTGWKPTMDKDARGPAADAGVGAGGATRGLVHEEQLLFERGSGGRCGVSLPPVPAGGEPSARAP
jgi:glycine dehydrogenase subunit 2